MEPERRNIWSLRTFCLITGSSRGLGKRMAVRFAQLLLKNSVIVLAARDSKGLTTAKQNIEELRDDIQVYIWVVDLAEVTETTLEESLATILTEVRSSPAEFQQAFVVHNAGSMGDISALFTGQMDCAYLNRYWRLNLTNVIVLNSVFWKKFDISSVQQKLVINITSICAKQAFKSWSIYCSGKLVCDMLSCSIVISCCFQLFVAVVMHCELYNVVYPWHALSHCCAIFVHLTFLIFAFCLNIFLYFCQITWYHIQGLLLINTECY